MRALAAASLAVCAACTSVEALPAPDRLDLKAILIGHLVNGALVRVDAVELESDDVTLPPFSLVEAASTTVVTVGYACSLEALGLSAGPIPPLSEPLMEGALPYPLRAQRMVVGGEGEPAWSTVSADAPEVDLLLRSVRVTVGTRCGLHGGQLVKRSVRIPPGAARPDRHVVRSVQALGDGRALVVTSTSSGHMSWVVSSDGAVRAVELRERARGVPLPADTLFVADRRGALWALTVTGSVARGTIEEGFEGVGRLPEGIGSPAAAVEDGEGGLLIVASSGEQARLIRWGDTEASEWVRVGVPSVAALGDGRVLLAGASFSDHPMYLATRDGSGWSVTDTAVSAHATPFDALAAVPTAVLTTRPGESVAASVLHACDSLFCRNFGTSLARLQGGAWTPLPGGYFDRLAALSLDPLDTRRLLLSNQALYDAQLRIDVYDPAVGVCLEADMTVIDEHRGRNDPPTRRMFAVPLDERRTLVLPSVSPDDAQILEVQESSRGCAVPL